ncbi:MAG: adenylyl cyclase, partial [Gaiellaceae bacterium]
PQGHSRRRLLRRLVFALAVLTSVLVTGAAGAMTPHGATAPHGAKPLAAPDFGPNVKILDPSMSQSDIQATLDSISSQQISNQFGSGRYAVLFKPGTYGSASTPLNFQVGYYTDIAGVGALPSDVTLNGTADVYNQCFGPNDCTALVNFWRSISNMTINVAGKGGCQFGEFWATSQATSMRRMDINGQMTFMDYCSAPSFASGGFLADSRGGTIINGSQQQYFFRNGDVSNWTNAVWNEVFAGVNGAPAQGFPNPPYTTLPTNPLEREKPFLYVDSNNRWNVFVPSAQRNTVGRSWANGQTPGQSRPISDFYIAKPTDSALKINIALALGKDLILTPGIYHLNMPLFVIHPDTVILGMGLATLVPDHGTAAMIVGDVRGVEISDVIFDAGLVKSPVLLQMGTRHAVKGQAREHNHWSDPNDPSALQDVYFRIGGDQAGKVGVAVEINSDNVLLDNIWSWRADHGNGVGWTSNTADTGLVVNGDDVTATGLFVEHYQKDETVWNGNGGKILFFQNEMPYDPPSQAAWTQPDGTLGYPVIHVTNGVKTFNAWGIGSYSFFKQGVDIHSANAFVVPTKLAPGSVKDAFTIFLSTAGFGGIDNVINGMGGSSTIANPEVVVPVVSYP